MAYADLSLLQKKFAALERHREDLHEKRKILMETGRMEEASGHFLEYAASLQKLEQVAQKLGYRDGEDAKKDVMSIWRQ